MKSLKIDKIFLFVLLVPTVSSLIISSVYAGKKKFKTFSFGSPLLPAIVKVQPHRLHLTFRQSRYLKTPQFHIEGTLPLKAPTIIKEILKPDPEPEVIEYNIGNTLSNEEPVYSDSNVHQSIAPINAPNIGVSPPLPPLPPPSLQPAPLQSRPPLPPSSSQFQPMPPPMQPLQTSASQNAIRIIDPPVIHPNNFQKHHQIRRSTGYNNQFHSDSQNPHFNANYGQNFQTPPQMNHQMLTNVNNYPAFGHNNNHFPPPNNQNYFDPNEPHIQHNPNLETTPFNNYNSPHNQHSDNIYLNNPNSHVVHQSSASLAPQKYKKVFVHPNPDHSKWTPITSGHSSYLPPPPLPPNDPNSGHSSNRVAMSLPYYSDPGDKKINIGEHYNPSASYLDGQVVEKPTYDPDEGSISFSISGPHGGEKVPFGYEAKIRQQQEELKKHPDHLPPGFDVQQLIKYYHHHTFTDNLKDNYGFVEAVGPLGFLKSKLSSLKKLI